MTKNDHILDCRGKLCPKPLLETRRAIEALPEGTLTVLVDHPAARENVSRAMLDAGHEVLVEEEEGHWTLRITKGAACRVPSMDDKETRAIAGKTVVLAADRTLGRSDPQLGAILMRSFMATIADLAQPPDEIILMQSGVRLACEGSDCLEALQALVERGVTILACGTCLDYFGLMDKLQIGQVSNMADISASLLAAGRIIPL